MSTIRIIERGWLGRIDLGELWRYRDLLLQLARRDIQLRYRQMLLGVAWAILQPVATMAVLSVVFDRFAKIPSDGFPYPLFAFAALLTAHPLGALSARPCFSHLLVGGRAQ